MIASGIAAARRRTGRGLTVTMLRAEEHWRIEFLGQPFYVRDSKGFRYLLRLVESPGRKLTLDEIVRAGEGDDEAAAPIDPIALFHERLQSARVAAGGGEDCEDRARRARLREAIERLAAARESSAALDLPPGREAPSERTRKSVAIALRRTIESITRQSPLLGAHLEIAIRTGASLAYVPDPLSGIEWRRERTPGLLDRESAALAPVTAPTAFTATRNTRAPSLR